MSSKVKEIIKMLREYIKINKHFKERKFDVDNATALLHKYEQREQNENETENNDL